LRTVECGAPAFDRRDGSCGKVSFFSPGDLLMHCLSDRFRRNQRGAAMVEYALLLALISVVGIVTITTLGQEVSNAFSALASDLASI
jgi:Flp pilus assembly pilin Flp